MSSRLTALRGRLRRPTRSSLELAVRAGVAAALSIWLADLAGLREPYWAGISAVVASAGTLGASIGAAVSRVSATVVGLLIGLALFALPVSATILSGVAVAIALVVFPAVSLDAGARLGAATTVIVTAIPGTDALSDALARGANIPLGCAVAVVLGFLLFPHRAGERLRADLRGDVEQAGTLARSALRAYAAGAVTDNLASRARALVRASSQREAALRDAAREPGVHGPSVLELQRQASAAGRFVENAAVLAERVEGATTDGAQTLVASELEHVADAFEASARLFGTAEADGFRTAVTRLESSLATMDAAFTAARARRATVEFATEDIARLLTVVHLSHDAALALETLAGVGERPEPAGRTLEREGR